MEYIEKSNIISIADLKGYGINTTKIELVYFRQTGIQLNLNDLVKVTSVDEGKIIRFETLDAISTTVTHRDALGVGNKDEIID